MNQKMDQCTSVQDEDDDKTTPESQDSSIMSIFSKLQFNVHLKWDTSSHDSHSARTSVCI